MPAPLGTGPGSSSQGPAGAEGGRGGQIARRTLMGSNGTVTIGCIAKVLLLVSTGDWKIITMAISGWDLFEVIFQVLPSIFWASPVAQMVKNYPANAGDPGLIPGLGRSPGEGNGNPLQYACLENSVDRGDWGATVHGVAKSRTWLSD